MIYPEGVREELDRICLQDPDKLSPEDLGFLRARRDYLDAPEKEKFATVLSDVEPMDESDLKDMEEIKAAEAVFDESLAAEDKAIAEEPKKKVVRKKK